MAEDKISLIKQMLETAERSLDNAHRLLADIQGNGSAKEKEQAENLALQTSKILTQDTGRVIEGYFDGQDMVGPNGQKYPVPANYASKSKILEGDLLKLTIASDGSFIYKQIGPVERKKVMGVLTKKANGEYRALVNKREYKVLLASITYFQGQPGDEVTLIVPQARQSSWAVIENIIKNTSQSNVNTGVSPDQAAAVNTSAKPEASPEAAATKLESLDLPAAKPTPKSGHRP